VTTARLNALDELYLHFDQEQEPWSVHVEVRLGGRADAARLRTAARVAAGRHPMARASLSPRGLVDRHYHWEVADEVVDLDVEEVECADDDDLDQARERLLNRTPSLDRPGPFALLLAHHADGDVVAINLHHAAGDGLSAVRLLASIARAYSGEDDPVPDVDPLAVRDVAAMVAPSTLRERMTRGLAALDYVARGASAPTRLAVDGGDDRPGYGFARMAFGPEEVEQLVRLRTSGATVNDVLLGALAVAIRRFNDLRGQTSGPVYLLMPVNLRPPEWRHEVVGNFASYVSVRVGSGQHETLEDAVAAAAASTRRIKDSGLAGLIVDLVDATSVVPTALRQRLPDLIPLTRDVVVDTAVLSNLGRVEDVAGFGDAGAVRELWFSPPGRMPLGASLGAATVGGRLFLTLRYRHAQFGAVAAERFLATLRSVLLAGADGP
jgi:NRPS condensation-like uncharacterized protein